MARYQKNLNRMIGQLDEQIRHLQALRDELAYLRTEMAIKGEPGERKHKEETTLIKIVKIVRDHGKGGIRVKEILNIANRSGFELGYNVLTSYLSRAKRLGYLRNKRPYWYFVGISSQEEIK